MLQTHILLNAHKAYTYNTKACTRYQYALCKAGKPQLSSAVSPPSAAQLRRWQRRTDLSCSDNLSESIDDLSYVANGE